jgi:UDP-N-acetylmuramoyl-tripeptide--D-alanyl-D-alanine ligase
VPGRHVVENALCAAAAAWATGLLEGQALDAVRAGLESFEALPGRLRVLQASGGLKVLDDSYNANPGSMEAALRTLHALHAGGLAITVLGDMLELGPEAEQLHADVGELAARLGVEVVIGVGPLAAHAVRAARAAGVENALEVPDTTAAAAEVRRLAAAGGTVLVKGSHSMHMERVVAALVEGA